MYAAVDLATSSSSCPPQPPYPDLRQKQKKLHHLLAFACRRSPHGFRIRILFEPAKIVAVKHTICLFQDAFDGMFFVVDLDLFRAVQREFDVRFCRTNFVSDMGYEAARSLVNRSGSSLAAMYCHTFV